MTDSSGNNIRRTDTELFAKFREQVELLELANSNYDSGIEIAALNIATTIRVMVHQTSGSTSALTHISKNHIEFLDTCTDDSDPFSVFLGLLQKSFIGVNDGIGGVVLYEPLFKSQFPLSKSWSSFDSWWNKIIFRNPDNTTLTRKELVLTVANKDGGAHIDKSITANFDKFRHSYSGGFTIKGINSGIVRDFDNVPINPALRQVSFELIGSFKNAGLF